MNKKVFLPINYPAGVANVEAYASLNRNNEVTLKVTWDYGFKELVNALAIKGKKFTMHKNYEDSHYEWCIKINLEEVKDLLSEKEWESKFTLDNE